MAMFQQTILSHLFIESRAEVLQSQIPKAHVVAAFNTITQELFEHANRSLGGLNIACFIAGNQPEAREIVAQLAASLGFTPVDCGELRQARLIESAADLVRMLMYKQKSPWASFSFTQVPSLQPSRLGGRQASSLTRATTTGNTMNAAHPTSIRKGRAARPQFEN